MILDVHAHFYPPEYMELVGATDVPYAAVAPLAPLNIDERLALMDRIGIDAQVLSISATQPYMEDAAGAVRAARLVNDLYREVCNEHPGRFYAFGALPLPHVEEAVAEICRCMDELNMVGITMGCSILGRQLSDVMFDPIYAELDRRSATLFLHPTGDMLTEVFDESGRLNFLVGFYMEDTLAALRLAQARVPSRYPRMNIIVPHLGGLLPLLIARLERAASPVLEELRKMWFDTLNDQVDVVSCACNALGSDRFVYGTDYPFANEAEYEQRLTRLTQLGLAVEEVDEIQGSRAARLLKISL